MKEHHVTKLSQDDLFPTPMIGAWVQWALDGARRPQPEMSLFAAIAGMAGILGRHYVFRDLFANQYVLAVCPTGGGKERMHEVIEAVYEATSCERILGGSTFGSGAGIMAALTQYSQRLWVQDEIQIQISKITRIGTNNYEAEVMGILLRLYTGKKDRGRELSEGQTETVREPYLNLLGLSQPNSLWPLMLPLRDNGTVGRFLAVQGDNTMPENRKAHLCPKEPPKIVIDTINDYNVWCSPNALQKTSLGHIVPKEMAIDQSGEDMLTEMQDTDDRERAEHAGDNHWYTVYARRTATAMKLAMLHAWSRNPSNATIDRAALGWGCRVFDASLTTMLAGLEMGTKSDARESAIDMIENHIRTQKRVPQIELYRRFRGTYGYKNIIEDLLTNGIIIRSVDTTTGRGRSPAYYTHKDYPHG